MTISKLNHEGKVVHCNSSAIGITHGRTGGIPACKESPGHTQITATLFSQTVWAAKAPVNVFFPEGLGPRFATLVFI